MLKVYGQYLLEIAMVDNAFVALTHSSTLRRLLYEALAALGLDPTDTYRRAYAGVALAAPLLEAREEHDNAPRFWQALEGISGLVAVNSLMAMVGGTLVALLVGRADPGFIHNGPLAGLVAVCAGSDLMHPLGALARRTDPELRDQRRRYRPGRTHDDGRAKYQHDSHRSRAHSRANRYPAGSRRRGQGHPGTDGAHRGRRPGRRRLHPLSA